MIKPYTPNFSWVQQRLSLSTSTISIARQVFQFIHGHLHSFDFSLLYFEIRGDNHWNKESYLVVVHYWSHWSLLFIWNMFGGSIALYFFTECISHLSLLFPWSMNERILIELRNRDDFALLSRFLILNFVYNLVVCVNNRL